MVIPIILRLVVAIFSPYDPLITDSLNRLHSPSLDHLMGTDDVGRDVLTCAAMGIRVSLAIGLMVTVISSLVGIAVGAISAYYPVTAKFLMRIVDGIMAFPTIILAITLAGVLGAGTKNIVVALAISYFPHIARVARGATLEVLGKSISPQTGDTSHTFLLGGISVVSLEGIIAMLAFKNGYFPNQTTESNFIPRGTQESVENPIAFLCWIRASAKSVCLPQVGKPVVNAARELPILLLFGR